VRTSARRAVNAAAQRRIDLQAGRARTSTVRDAFPDVGVIHIDLGFSHHQPAPSPQMHSMYPAARAFFRFSCPCADCDGEFDLAAVVTELATASAPGKRTARSVAGRSGCGGTHWRDSDHSEPCRIELSFRVAVSFT
jgi:hypothetical protein